MEYLEEMYCKIDVDKPIVLYFGLELLCCIKKIWLTKTVTSKINLVLLIRFMKIFYNTVAIGTVQNVDSEQAANIWK